MSRNPHAIYMRKWFKKWSANPKNRQILTDYARLMRLAFPENSKESYRRNRAKRNRYDRLRYRRNPELRCASHRAYKEKWSDAIYMYGWIRHLMNPHHRKFIRSIRRARAYKIGIEAKLEIDAVYARCQELKQYFDVVVDHIRPLSKGGKHLASNLQIIDRLENLKKKAKLNYRPSVVFS